MHLHLSSLILNGDLQTFTKNVKKEEVCVRRAFVGFLYGRILVGFIVVIL